MQSSKNGPRSETDGLGSVRRRSQTKTKLIPEIHGVAELLLNTSQFSTWLFYLPIDFTLVM
jgi:hypothetical protein